jgi:hypothetical protein
MAACCIYVYIRRVIWQFRSTTRKRFFEAECNHERLLESLDIKEWATRAEKMAMRPAIAAVFEMCQDCRERCAFHVS